MYDGLSERIASVKEKIASALKEAGRTDDVLLVGASKTTSQEVIDRVDKEGLLTALGENRAQELLSKYREGQRFNWHFIGSLQTNKVKNIIDKVSLIHTVDRRALAETIDKCAGKIGKIQDVLLQINMGREESKSGYYPEDALCALSELKRYDNLNFVGLMAVMPIAEEEELIRLYGELKDIYHKAQAEFDGIKYLSAGMTNDYELAIKYAHSNIVRVGRAIFGERNYNV